MTDIIQLDELKPGQTGTVKELILFDEMRRRLQDIGIIKGTKIECIIKSPLGDPTAYFIKGAVIALRKEDAGKVIIEKIK